MIHYVWLITKNCLTEKPHPAYYLDDKMGPHGTDLTPEDVRKHPKAVEYRLKDGDDEVYFYGLFVDLSPEGTEDEFRPSEFEPLDDYGRAFGCVSIEYKQDNEYVQL